MEWKSELYDTSQAFVSEYGKDLISLVPKKTGSILDLGCGTGDLTQKLNEFCNQVIGIDGSKEMIATARSKYPNLHFDVMDACQIPWQNEFDVIFSNAVFHWIPNQKLLLEKIIRALKENGLLICEFGASGNISQIETAYRTVLKSYQNHYENPFFFPTVEAYSHLLREAGFTIEKIYDYDRPTPLPDGKNGLRKWMLQFFSESLSVYDPDQQNHIFEDVEQLLFEKMYNGTTWTADYRRIRVVSRKA